MSFCTKKPDAPIPTVNGCGSSSMSVQLASETLQKGGIAKSDRDDIDELCNSHDICYASCPGDVHTNEPKTNTLSKHKEFCDMKLIDDTNAICNTIDYEQECPLPKIWGKCLVSGFLLSPANVCKASVNIATGALTTSIATSAYNSSIEQYTNWESNE